MLNLKNHLLYWGKKIDAWHVAHHRLTYQFTKLLLGSLILLSLSGKIALILFIWESFAYHFGTLRLLFSSAFDARILFFWLSVLIDLYIFYRLTWEIERQVRLPKYTETRHGKRLTEDRPRYLEVARYYNEESLRTVEHAWKLAHKYSQPSVLPLHLFIALLDTQNIKLIFARLGINYNMLVETLARQIKKRQETTEEQNIVLSSETRYILSAAFILASSDYKKKVDETSLLRAVTTYDTLVKELLYNLKIDENKLLNVISWIDVEKKLTEQGRQFRARARLKPKGHMDRAMTALATPLLDNFSTDITLFAKRGYLDPLVGREKELDQIFRLLEGGHENVVLMGPPGVGKTALIEGLAQLMVEERVPSILQDKRLVSLNAARLVSGVTASQAGERLIAISDEIARAGNIILVIENVNLFIGISTGGEQSLDLADILADVIRRKLFLTIATSEPLQYQRESLRTTLGQMFHIVRVDEPDENLAIQVLESKTMMLEYRHNVFFSYDALAELIRLSFRYFPETYMPQKAIDLLEEIAIYKAKKGAEDKVIKVKDVAAIVSDKIKIPVSQVSETEAEKLLNLEKLIHKKIINQEEAVKAVAAAIRRARTELADKDRPIANLLFLGPTGVGKTELSKTVAEIYFGSRDSMIRLDMSEYQDTPALQKLIGQGGTSGLLSREVKNKPFSLLLLDELEKANADVLNIFLQVMDDGRLTDGTGRTLDFTNIIIIATSNAGSQFIQDSIKSGVSVRKITDDLINKELKHYFLPEFLNRFDGIIVFKPLTMVEVKAIAELLVGELKIRLKNLKGIVFKVDDAALLKLAEEGYQPEFGARPLRRVIQERIDNPLSKLLLQDEIKRRDEVIYMSDGRFKIVKAEEL